MSNSADTCPKCLSDLQGEPIPQEYIDAGYYGDKTHYSRRIGIYSTDTDRTTHWRCPDCNHEWPR